MHINPLEKTFSDYEEMVQRCEFLHFSQKATVVISKMGWAERLVRKIGSWLCLCDTAIVACAKKTLKTLADFLTNCDPKFAATAFVHSWSTADRAFFISGHCASLLKSIEIRLIAIQQAQIKKEQEVKKKAQEALGSLQALISGPHQELSVKRAVSAAVGKQPPPASPLTHLTKSRPIREKKIASKRRGRTNIS